MPQSRKKTETAKIPKTPAKLSLLSPDDLYLFNEGSHHRLFNHLGAHLATHKRKRGVYFAVWAPDAEAVSVIGDFNSWDRQANYLDSRESSGIWEGFIPGVKKGDIYKFHIRSRYNNYCVDKADPFAIHAETPPKTGSIVWDMDYNWNDEDWMANRASSNSLSAPMSVYEVHLGSWRWGDDRPLTYRETAPLLAKYVSDMGFTHVEFLPIMEHPFRGSWGYQTVGYFAPTSRYGTPQDFMFLIDTLHQAGISVILDWVPSHFPTDEHGLGFFDGTHLFEHASPSKGFHPDWKSYIFNYSRSEVQSFLISSALFWLDKYHADGLRVDAVASMLYLDYSREDGEWMPNEYGGRENLDAISFLRRLNEVIYQNHPDVQTIAEESTSWPRVSRPTYDGGLGFGLKWDMGWMHDSLRYLSRDSVHRSYHHNELTFRLLYAFQENFMLPLSHDEVVHGKSSLLGKMPGDDWQKFANLRLLFTYMFTQPGKKLLFMGGEFGQWSEWNHDVSLDWHLLEYDRHVQLQSLVRDLNRLLRKYPALHKLDHSWEGFEWIDPDDSQNSTLSYLRKNGQSTDDQEACANTVVIALNFTSVPRHDFKLEVPAGGGWKEIFNSDSALYGGSDVVNPEVRYAGVSDNFRKFEHFIEVSLPPLGAVIMVQDRE